MSQRVKSTTIQFPTLTRVPEDSRLQCLHETEMNLRSQPIPEKEAAWAKQYYVEFCDVLAHGPDKVLTFLERIMPRFNQEFKRPHPFDPADFVGLMEWRAYEILYVRNVVQRTCRAMYILEIQNGTADGTDLSSVDSTPTRNKPVSRTSRNAARAKRVAHRKYGGESSDDDVGFGIDDVPRMGTPEYEKIISDLGLTATMLCNETDDLVTKSTLWKDTVRTELGLSPSTPTQTPTPRRSPRGHRKPNPPVIDLKTKVPILTAKAKAARLTERMLILQQAGSSSKRVAANSSEGDSSASKKRRVA